MERYTEKEEIGKGAFGTVYIATDKVTGELHALKELNTEAKKILPELGALMKVKPHPGVVKFKGMFITDEGSTMLTMEYCSGGNLDTFWQREKPNLEIKHSFMKEISEALNHLHQNGIVHRDIKPENILVAPDEHGGNHPKLADFGQAKWLTVKQI
ncbi:probable myosin light chain kinase DDB_G0282429 [Amphiura filiformis]|uniref:probable myosin light chain kinase DDB_G0282429 n=1 Tax=Amphiura filiformis TaxID=82378 RepID=UPI003B21C93C